jgi:DNA repair exonuclease SbcCD ATPase subunit
MSTVVLKSLVWNKCFSFGDDNSITLSGEPLTQIIAPNGFGKSSIPLIIEEALYNKNSKGVKKSDIPNRLLDGSYTIDIDFAVGVDEYRVEIIRGANIKVKLFKDSEDISSHTATNTFKTIETLMGMDFKTFQQLVYQSTNSSLQFLTATDTARKKFLIDLFDLSDYTGFFEVFKEAAKNLGTDISKLEGQVNTINQWLDSNSGLDLEEIPLLVEIDTVDRSEEIGSLLSQIQNISTDNKRIESNRKLIKQQESIDIDAALEVLENNTKLSYDEMQSEIGNLKSQETSAQAVLKKLEGLEDKCPTCMQDIDKEFYNSLVSDSTSTRDEARKRLKDISDSIEEIKKTNRIIELAEMNVANWNTLEAKIDSNLPDTIQVMDDLEERLNAIRKEVSDAEATAASIRKKNQVANQHNSKINIYLEQNSKFEEQLKEARNSLNLLTETFKDLEVLKKAFSTNGLIAFKLENLVKDLEDYANEYLSELSDGRFTIEFAISGDKLNVVVTDDGKEISISSPSSGEMARINISTLLAIRKLMAGISKNTINVLFLDEVISVLDDYGRERLVEVLLEEQGLNTFLVSHSWTHPLVDKLVLTKEDGISRII